MIETPSAHVRFYGAGRKRARGLAVCYTDSRPVIYYSKLKLLVKEHRFNSRKMLFKYSLILCRYLVHAFIK